MDNCPACTHLKNESNRLMKTRHWVVDLAPDQGYLGRCYVTLHEHKGSLASLTDEEWLEYGAIVRKLEPAVQKAFGAVLSNWACMMNNAYQQSASDGSHVHWHFRPRYDRSVSVNGVEFGDPLFGYHYDREQRNYVDADTFQAIRQRLQAALET